MHDGPTRRLTRTELLVGGAAALAGARLLRLVEGVAVAATGRGSGPTLVVRDEPLGTGRRIVAGGPRELAPRPTPPFTLVGLHWRGDGEVSFRTLDSGGWAPWQRAVVHELPNPGTEDRRPGWKLGTPVWTGGSTAIQYRVDGRVTALRAHFVQSLPEAGPRRLDVAGEPPIVSRSAWGADESIVRAVPSYADSLRFAIVHHTAGQLPKTPADSAALVRGIERYHVQGNGWNDIGYNFLVDPFGQVFEGRGGGVDRNVIGAHALGFNTGSVGVAVLGNYDVKPVSSGAVAALVSLLAWRLDVGHVDPLATVTVIPTTGAARTIRAISGHRDVNPTACPGALLYPQLDVIAAQIAATGAPKLYDPAVQQTGTRAFTFSARLSEALPWTVTVTGPDGAAAGFGSGVGNLISWAWDASSLGDGSYAWTISAGTGVLPASGRLVLGTPAGQPPSQSTPPPPRPGSVPKKVPAWAWELEVWHTTPKGQRGPRPAGAPKKLPSWYWPWLNWRVALERWQIQQSLGEATG